MRTEASSPLCAYARYGPKWMRPIVLATSSVIQRLLSASTVILANDEIIWKLKRSHSTIQSGAENHAVACRPESAVSPHYGDNRTTVITVQGCGERPDLCRAIRRITLRLCHRFPDRWANHQRSTNRPRRRSSRRSTNCLCAGGNQPMHAGGVIERNFAIQGYPPKRYLSVDPDTTIRQRCDHTNILARDTLSRVSR